MEQGSRDDLESDIRSALEGRDFQACATLTLKGYGPEVLGYLLGRLGDETLAADAFAVFTADLWRALPTLQLAVTMRAYAYAVARNAASRLLARQVKNERKGVPLSAAEPWLVVAEEVRAKTLPHLRSTLKTRVQELRARLSEEEQTLLTLRVDRGLSWPEIATVYAGGRALDATTLARDAARLRKRFEATKDRLREMAREAGLLSTEHGDDERDDA